MCDRVWACNGGGKGCVDVMVMASGLDAPYGPFLCGKLDEDAGGLSQYMVSVLLVKGSFIEETLVGPCLLCSLGWLGAYLLCLHSQPTAVW